MGSTYKDVAKGVILAYLETGYNAPSFYEMYEINNGNDEILLEHIKALHNIFGKAIKEMEDQNGKEDSITTCE